VSVEACCWTEKAKHAKHFGLLARQRSSEAWSVAEGQRQGFESCNGKAHMPIMKNRGTVIHSSDNPDFIHEGVLPTSYMKEY